VLIAVGFSLFSKNLFDFSLMGIWWVHVVLLVCVCGCECISKNGYVNCFYFSRID
jgi:hypothetical protein